MASVDHDTLREWLDLELEGELEAARRAPLQAHLSACADCRREREELLALRALLADDRAVVRADFRDGVMAALPAAAWQARHARAWRMPAALLALLLGAAAVLTAVGGAQPRDGGSLLSAVAAVFGFLTAGLAAGLGLLGASWRGLSLAFREVLATSPGGVVAFVVLVVALHLLVWTLLRRRRAAAERSSTGRRR